MANGRLRIGYPALGAYALACDYRTFALSGQNATLIHGQIDQPFDYYIATTGNTTTGDGSYGNPWGIDAIWLKTATYKNHSVGVLPGSYSPYNGTIVLSNNDCALYVPSSASGTSGARTVISSVSPRGAIIVGDGGHSASGATRASVGIQVDATYVTIRGFKVKEVWGKGIQASVQNVTVENNEIFDVNRSTYWTGAPDQVDNTCGLRTDADAGGFVARNNKVYNIRNGGRSINETALELYEAPSAIVENNDFSDATTLIYLKQSASGAQVRYNYLHDGANAFNANNNNTFQFDIHHNVIAGVTTMVYNGIVADEVAGTSFYNNTIIFTVNTRTGLLFRATSAGPVSAYNNLIVRNGGAPQGTDSYYDMNGSSGAFGLLDYNLYSTAAQFTSPNGTLKTFATWKTATGKDAGAISADPTFTGGTGPYAYKLNGASAGFGQGHVGGTSGGAACNMGAYESAGQTEQIGADF